MNRSMLKHYTKLVEFLGLALGPNYEITLHDINNRTSTIVAIVNGEISGRTLDSPPSENALRAIAENGEGRDYRINYNGLSGNNKVLRSSTYYIKDPAGTLVGMLCINFDDSGFQALSSQLFQLIHPNKYIENNMVVRSDVMELADDCPERPQTRDSVTFAAESVIQEILKEEHLPVGRLTQAEKTHIVSQLDQHGVFKLRGAVDQVSQALGSSPASIYRYLSKVRKQQDEPLGEKASRNRKSDPDF